MLPTEQNSSSEHVKSLPTYPQNDKFGDLISDDVPDEGGYYNVDINQYNTNTKTKYYNK